MRNGFNWLVVLGLSLAIGIAEQVIAPLSQSAIAQVAEVPQPDRNGDFNTAVLRGNAGSYYPNTRWLVMPQPDSSGVLNCRESPNGRIKSRIAPGAIIQAIFNGPLQLQGRGGPPNPAADAIDLSIGRPWLHVIGTESLVIPMSSEEDDRSEPKDCYVRANLRYIAPVNEEADTSF
ncbi:MAG: hypothetical protein DCF25_00275 [Leptolyngbya foveolarum]|uniref:Uncharacterized protein n=1 Tax=Leptolyngbya foveolarum TaxID=47253 RepID=A0A2W4URM5_9CYAN|nr:MAG: hypothetical protein DCF25_00275 [Leptolyngbya foveolarum]